MQKIDFETIVIQPLRTGLSGTLPPTLYFSTFCMDIVSSKIFRKLSLAILYLVMDRRWSLKIKLKITRRDNALSIRQ